MPIDSGYNQVNPPKVTAIVLWTILFFPVGLVLAITRSEAAAKVGLKRRPYWEGFAMGVALLIIGFYYVIIKLTS